MLCLLRSFSPHFCPAKRIPFTLVERAQHFDVAIIFTCSPHENKLAPSGPIQKSVVGVVDNYAVVTLNNGAGEQQ